MNPATGTNGSEPSGAVLVCGGGIAGIQASIDLSAAGFRVYVVEKSPTIGGGMSQLDKTFPTGDCATCIISPKLVEFMRDHNIDLMTLSEITELEGEAGNFTVKVRQNPRGVDINKCTGCGECWQSCPVSNVPQDITPFTPSETLNDVDHAWIDSILERHQNDPAPLIQVLQIINDERGYLPRSMLEYLTVRFEIPLTEIYRVASFYNVFNLEPAGRHTIEICLGTSCYMRGSGRLLNRLEQTIGIREGETTEDSRFTLRTVRCIGCCALAPSMRIDGVTFGNINHNTIPDILEKFE